MKTLLQTNPFLICYCDETFNYLEGMRWRVKLFLVKFLVFSVLGLYLTMPGVVSAQVVDIPDANLRAAIAEALNKAQGDVITRSEMETLVELRASGSGITDLRGIEFAINLTRLNLYNNTISDISAVANLTNLTSLTLSNNTISDISSVANLTNLTWLNLYNNTISDISAVANLTNLTSLNLSNNSVSDILAVANLTNLTSLNLSNNNVSDISAVANLTNLTWLNVYNNTISDILAVANLTNLTSLTLADNTISDILAVANLTNLTWLNVYNNTISDISAVANLTNLTSLNLSNNNVSDIETLERLMAQGTVVYFSGNPAFETPGPKIEDGWVWLIVPAMEVSSGSDAARSGRDFLSEASGGVVTEADVAVSGARAGTRVGNSVWTSATLSATDPDNLNAILSGHNLGIDIPYPIAYGVVSIQSEIQQETRVYIGGGPVKVWLNGTLVYRDTNFRSVSDYETAVPVVLMPGNNLLFIAAYRQSSGSRWSAFFGFQDDTAEPPGPPGAGDLDVNGDGQVTVIDLAIVALFYGTQVPDGISIPADVNDDGTVDLSDLTAVAQAIDAAGNAGTLSIDDMQVVLEAVAEQANAIEEIAEAPAHFGTSQHARFAGIAYQNVAAAFADAKYLTTDDVHLGKWMPLLRELLHLLAEMQEIPDTTALLPNYPNPFNPETWIPYHLSKGAEVTLTIYDVSGSTVRSLTLGHQSAGIYESRARAAYWDGRNQHGEPVASGVYFYTLTAGEFTATRKLLIIK